MEFAAARGSAAAIRKLDGPPFVDELEYLYDWAMELDRARSFGVNGAEPITYQALESWARLTGRTPAPHEVAALMLVDRVLLFPPVADE